MPVPAIDLDFLLSGDPTQEQIREFWRDGEFFEEHYLVAAIKRHLLTEEQRREMYDRNVSIEDLLNGRVAGEHADWQAAVFNAWNQTLEFTAFGS